VTWWKAHVQVAVVGTVSDQDARAEIRLLQASGRSNGRRPSATNDSRVAVIEGGMTCGWCIHARVLWNGAGLVPHVGLVRHNRVSHSARQVQLHNLSLLRP
jgi:hypothetical protein